MPSVEVHKMARCPAGRVQLPPTTDPSPLRANAPEKVLPSSAPRSCIPPPPPPAPSPVQRKAWLNVLAVASSLTYPATTEPLALVAKP